MLKLELQIPTPNDWRKDSLKNVCEVLSRGTAPSYVERSNVLAIGQRCVQEFGFDASAARPHDATKMNGVLIAQIGDVLLNSTGTGTIGRSCIFNDVGIFIVDGHVTLLRPKPKE